MGFCGRILDNGHVLRPGGGEFFGVYLCRMAPEDNWVNSVQEGTFTSDKGSEFLSCEYSAPKMTYADAMNIECNLAQAHLKDVWVDGYFKNSMAEKGISAALDAFENTEYTGNKRRLVYVSAIDTILLSDEIISRANALNVQIDTVYLGDVEYYKEINMKNISEQTGGKQYYGQSIYELQDQLYYRKLDDSVSLSDYDGDGIPDDYELAGLYLCNGQIVYTDPTLADTDGDGISDGEELGITDKLKASDMVPVSMLQILLNGETIQWKKKYAFRIISNPAEIDSDGDGIRDNYDRYDNKTMMERYSNLSPLKQDTIESLYPELELSYRNPSNSKDNAVYFEIDGNNINMIVKTHFEGSYADKFIENGVALEQTYKDAVIAGLKYWEGEYTGAFSEEENIHYDFVDGLKFNLKVTVTECGMDENDLSEQKYVNIKVDNSEYDENKISLFSPNHIPNTSTWDWAPYNIGFWVGTIKMFNSYQDKGKYNFDSYYRTLAHEFGHVLGLDDAYPEANDGINLPITDEVKNEFKELTIMYQNQRVLSNDIEMMFEAFSTLKMQSFIVIDKKKISQVIRLQ